MIRYYIVIYILLCDVALLFAQEEFSYSVEKAIVGEELPSGKSFLGKQFQFQEPIEYFWVDTATKTLIVSISPFKKNGKTFKNKGWQVGVDYSNNKVKWKRYYKSGIPKLYFFNGYFIEFLGGRSGWINYDSGEPFFNCPGEKIIYYPDKKIVIYLTLPKTGYPKREFILTSQNVETKEILWKHTLSKNLVFKSISLGEDTILFLKDQYLKYYNLNTGLFNTYLDDEVKTANDLRGTSKIIYNHKEFFQLLKDKLVKVDLKKKEILWALPIDPAKTGQSYFTMEDSILYLTSIGKGYQNNILINYGNPSITAVNKNSGKIIFQRIWKHDNSPINNTITDSSGIYVSRRDRIEILDSKTGITLKERKLDFDSTGYADYWLRKDLFIYDSLNKPIKLQDVASSDLFIRTGLDTIWILDNDLDIISGISPDSLLTPYYFNTKFKFIPSTKGIWIQNENDSCILKLDNSPFIVDQKRPYWNRHGNVFFFQKANTILVADISEFLKEEED